MYPLTRLYARKLYRQKLISIFFACFFTASFFYAFLISTPQMEEMLNINIGIVGRCRTANFLSYLLHKYCRLKSNILNNVSVIPPLSTAFFYLDESLFLLYSFQRN